MWAAGRSTPSTFQSHAGSIGAEVVALELGDIELFQSHAGSIEALARASTLARTEMMVSIPRWFD